MRTAASPWLTLTTPAARRTSVLCIHSRSVHSSSSSSSSRNELHPASLPPSVAAALANFIVPASFSPTPFPEDKFLSLKTRTFHQYERILRDSGIALRLSGRDTSSKALTVAETERQSAKIVSLEEQQGFVLTDEVVYYYIHINAAHYDNRSTSGTVLDASTHRGVGVGGASSPAPALGSADSRTLSPLVSRSSLLRFIEEYLVEQRRGPPYPLPLVSQDLIGILQRHLLFGGSSVVGGAADAAAAALSEVKGGDSTIVGDKDGRQYILADSNYNFAFYDRLSLCVSAAARNPSSLLPSTLPKSHMSSAAPETPLLSELADAVPRDSFMRFVEHYVQRCLPACPDTDGDPASSTYTDLLRLFSTVLSGEPLDAIQLVSDEGQPTDATPESIAAVLFPLETHYCRGASAEDIVSDLRDVLEEHADGEEATGNEKGPGLAALSAECLAAVDQVGACSLADFGTSTSTGSGGGMSASASSSSRMTYENVNELLTVHSLVPCVLVADRLGLFFLRLRRRLLCDVERRRASDAAKESARPEFPLPSAQEQEAHVAALLSSFTQQHPFKFYSSSTSSAGLNTKTTTAEEVWEFYLAAAQVAVEAKNVPVLLHLLSSFAAGFLHRSASAVTVNERAWLREFTRRGETSVESGNSSPDVSGPVRMEEGRARLYEFCGSFLSTVFYGLHECREEIRLLSGCEAAQLLFAASLSSGPSAGSSGMVVEAGGSGAIHNRKKTATVPASPAARAAALHVLLEYVDRSAQETAACFDLSSGADAGSASQSATQLLLHVFSDLMLTVGSESEGTNNNNYHNNQSGANAEAEGAASQQTVATYFKDTAAYVAAVTLRQVPSLNSSPPAENNIRNLQQSCEAAVTRAQLQVYQHLCQIGKSVNADAASEKKSSAVHDVLTAFEGFLNIWEEQYRRVCTHAPLSSAAVDGGAATSEVLVSGAAADARDVQQAMLDSAVCVSAAATHALLSAARTAALRSVLLHAQASSSSLAEGDAEGDANDSADAATTSVSGIQLATVCEEDVLPAATAGLTEIAQKLRASLASVGASSAAGPTGVSCALSVARPKTAAALLQLLSPLRLSSLHHLAHASEAESSAADAVNGSKQSVNAEETTTGAAVEEMWAAAWAVLTQSLVGSDGAAADPSHTPLATQNIVGDEEEKDGERSASAGIVSAGALGNVYGVALCLAAQHGEWDRVRRLLTLARPPSVKASTHEDSGPSTAHDADGAPTRAQTSAVLAATLVSPKQFHYVLKRSLRATQTDIAIELRSQRENIFF